MKRHTCGFNRHGAALLSAAIILSAGAASSVHARCIADPQDPRRAAPGGGADAFNTAFTYQGLLTDAGAPVAGPVDLRFRLFDGPAGGSQQGLTLALDNANLLDGVMSVELDFGNGIFNGGARWLQVECEILPASART